MGTRGSEVMVVAEEGSLARALSCSLCPCQTRFPLDYVRRAISPHVHGKRGTVNSFAEPVPFAPLFKKRNKCVIIHAIVQCTLLYMYVL